MSQYLVSLLCALFLSNVLLASVVTMAEYLIRLLCVSVMCVTDVTVCVYAVAKSVFQITTKRGKFNVKRMAGKIFKTKNKL